jgi:hypothetical protein
MSSVPSDTRLPGMPPKAQPFHMSELFTERGVWSFWLTADETLTRFVNHLPCVVAAPTTPFGQRKMGARSLIMIDARYDAHQAWAWIREMLEAETVTVELRDDWEQAIHIAFDAHQSGGKLASSDQT